MCCLVVLKGKERWAWSLWPESWTARENKGTVEIVWSNLSENSAGLVISCPEPLWKELKNDVGDRNTLSCSITDTEIVANGYIHWSRHWLSGMQLVKHRALLLGEATFLQVGKEILLLTEIFGKREEFSDWLPLSYAFIAQWIWEEAAACHLKQLAQSQVLVISRRVPEKPLA